MPSAHNQAPVTLVFAGGGTGGHLMPGLAIAERVRERQPDARMLFLCADREIDRRILGPAGVKYLSLPARPPALRPLPAAPLAFVRDFRRSVRIAADAMGELASHSGAEGGMCVVMLGGFVSGPAAWAARFRLRTRPRPPIVLVNLDRVPGRANRFVGRLSDHVLTAMEIIDPSPVFRRAEMVGMPIRRRALSATAADACRQRFGLEPARSTLLVTGASQGAESLNRLMVAFADSAMGRQAFATGWQVLHLAGDAKAEDREALEAAYRRAGIRSAVLGFCDEMGLAWGAADLALSRAGASSVAEAVANGVPTVFAPYPWHADRHQERNAEPVVARGGGWMTTDHVDPVHNLEGLGRLLATAMSDDDTLRRAAVALREHRLPDAAEVIAQRLLSWAQSSRGTPVGGSPDPQASTGPGPAASQVST